MAGAYMWDGERSILRSGQSGRRSGKAKSEVTCKLNCAIPGTPLLLLWLPASSTPGRLSVYAAAPDMGRAPRVRVGSVQGLGLHLS